jgi:hypothetical protein
MKSMFTPLHEAVNRISVFINFYVHWHCQYCMASVLVIVVEASGNWFVLGTRTHVR